MRFYSVFAPTAFYMFLVPDPPLIGDNSSRLYVRGDGVKKMSQTLFLIFCGTPLAATTIIFHKEKSRRLPELFPKGYHYQRWYIYLIYGPLLGIIFMRLSFFLQIRGGNQPIFFNHLPNSLFFPRFRQCNVVNLCSF